MCGERIKEGGACHGEGSQRAGGEHRCLGDDCGCSLWSKPISLAYAMGSPKQKGGVWGSGDMGLQTGAEAQPC